MEWQTVAIIAIAVVGTLIALPTLVGLGFLCLLPFIKERF